MANTSPQHKEKKSQKRKDRQKRREQKKLLKSKKLIQIDSYSEETSKTSNESQKKTKKSLPGYLAKNKDLICRWLNEYLLLEMRIEDEYPDYVIKMDREKRNKFLEDYVMIREFVKNVKNFQEQVDS